VEKLIKTGKGEVRQGRIPGRGRLRRKKKKVEKGGAEKKGKKQKKNGT